MLGQLKTVKFGAILWQTFEIVGFGRTTCTEIPFEIENNLKPKNSTATKFRKDCLHMVREGP